MHKTIDRTVTRLAIGAAIMALGLAAPAFAGGKHGHAPHHYSHGAKGGTIVVSCFRGPWNEVIWDRPNAVFVDSLVAIGYSFPTAHAIAERVCRDEALVGNPEAMKSTMLRIHADAASRRGRNH